jgi:GWxTD domain-containing protein
MNQAPSTFMGHTFFPTDTEATETVFMFKIGYDQLTFLRNQTANGEQYLSEVELIIDIYDEDTAEVPDRAFIERRTWTKSVVANNYEDTQSSDLFVEGLLKFELQPDRYRYVTTININGQSRLFSIPGSQSEVVGMLNPNNRRNNQRNRSLRQFVHVPNLKSETSSTTIAFLEPTSSDSLVAFNIGSNIYYSKDYKILVGVITKDQPNYNVEIINLGARLSRNEEADSSAYNVVFTSKLGPETRLSDNQGLFLSTNDQVSTLRASGYEYHVVTVPNSKYPNSWYRVRVVDSSSNDATTGSQIVLSRWFDIPSSLLNLDIALENMRFIVDENQLKELRRGNSSEKEQKFRTFWEQRDPTPETEFNELMTEYYKRIDQAYEQFTTPSKPGHESDQGKIYIVYGPPENVDRRFPSSGNAQEVWTYGDRTFIFTATTGFGDFQLVTQ